MNVTSQITRLKNQINETETKIRNVKRWNFIIPIILLLGAAACVVAAYFGFSNYYNNQLTTQVINGVAYASVSSVGDAIFAASIISAFLAAAFIVNSILSCVIPGLSRDQITEMNNWEKSLMADREELKQLQTQPLPACSNDLPVCPHQPPCMPLPQVVS